MHELSIISSVIESCVQEAEKHRALKIDKIVLSVGEKSGVVMEALEFAFEVARNNTMAEKAELVIEKVPLVVKCTNCGHSFRSENGFMVCEICEEACKIVSGRELSILSVEMDVPEESAEKEENEQDNAKK